MSSPIENEFTAFQALSQILNANNMPLFKTLNYLNGDDQIEYHCVTNVVDATDTDAVWMIWKRTYGGTNDDVLLSELLPDDGAGFKYAPNAAATYFT